MSGMGLLFFFALLVLPLAVIHKAADRRLFIGGNFDQVQARLASEAYGFRGGHDADLFICFVDQADGRDSDLFVATQTVLANGGSSCVGLWKIPVLARG